MMFNNVMVKNEGPKECSFTEMPNGIHVMKSHSFNECMKYCIYCGLEVEIKEPQYRSKFGGIIKEVSSESE